MDRIAVFVDAGYLFAAGSAVLSGGQSKKRKELNLDSHAVIKYLIAKALDLSGLSSVLRIYWYDGALPTGLTTDQTSLGFSNNVKLRLGVVSGLGQQKGVDSRIVTDLAELARKRAICEAALIDGDEDLRIGMEIAQDYGVRVHLLTVQDSAVAPLLRREADTASTMSPDEIGKFLTILSDSGASAPGASAPGASVNFTSIVATYCGSLDAPGREALKNAIKASDTIPREHDGRLLAQARSSVSRDLTSPERTELRKELKAQLSI